jgi:hypothetical protein
MDHLCREDGCARPVLNQMRQLCSRNYQRFKKAGGLGKQCGFPGCGDPHWAKGYCSKHYRRLHNHGDPAIETQPGRSMSLEQRILSRIDRRGADDCWLWTDRITEAGYATYGVPGTTAFVHRWMYQRFVGPIPDGAELDHRCHSDDKRCPGGPCVHRRCVNPQHLEAVSHRTNMLRGRGVSAENVVKTHCLNGHPFDAGNTYIHPKKGTRRCRACQSERSRKAYERRKAAKPG